MPTRTDCAIAGKLSQSPICKQWFVAGRWLRSVLISCTCVDNFQNFHLFSCDPDLPNSSSLHKHNTCNQEYVRTSKNKYSLMYLWCNPSDQSGAQTWSARVTEFTYSKVVCRRTSVGRTQAGDVLIIRKTGEARLCSYCWMSMFLFWQPWFKYFTVKRTQPKTF